MSNHNPHRNRLPDERAALIHKFNVSGHEGYVHVGLYADGKPGEIFITMSKQGSTISGLCDAVAVLTSMCLQYNVPLEALVRKFARTRFEPSGYTGHPTIGQASSILDYVFRWLALKFLDTDADTFDAGMPLAEKEPPLLPEGELERRHNERLHALPIDAADVLQQAIEIGSGLTAAEDPTKGGTR